MTLGYYTFGIPQYQKRKWSLQAIESPLMIEGKNVPKAMLVEWNQNTFITVRSLDRPMVQVPMTLALMLPQPSICYMRNWTTILCSKPKLTLTYWSQGKNKKHCDGLCKNRISM